MIRVLLVAACLVLSACAGGKGIQECASDDDCAGGSCVAGQCATEACSDDFDCPLGFLCLDGACRNLDDFDASGPGEDARGSVDAPAEDLGGTDVSEPSDAGIDPVADGSDDTAQGGDGTEDAPVDIPVDVPVEDSPGEPDVVEPQCLADTDCDPDHWCNDGACVPGCHVDEACPEGEACDLDAHLCVPLGCRDDVECAMDEMCDLISGECVPARDWVACTHNGECPDGEVCTLQDIGDDLVAACGPEVGSGAHGSRCSGDEECRSGSCQGDTIRRCVGVCAGDDDCLPDNTACVEVEFELDDRRTVVHNICDWAPGSGRSCTRNGACRGEVCTLNLDGEEPALVCRPAWGEVGPGGACEFSNDCETGMCVGGECFGACDVDTDCVEGTECFAVNLFEGLDPISLCTAPPPICRSDEDCDDGLFCLPFVDEEENMLVPYCFPPTHEGGSLAGQRCFDDTDCASGFCLASNRDGLDVCYGVCDQPTVGCNGGTRCYPDQISYTFDQGTRDTLDDQYHSTSACLPDFGSYQECRADTNCPNDEICMPTRNQTADDWVLRCIDPINPGAARAGVRCTLGDDCASATCLPDLIGSVCFGTCRRASHCPDGLRCSEVYNFVVNDRGTPNDELDDIAVAVSQCTRF